jgi:hypothetical protein
VIRSIPMTRFFPPVGVPRPTGEGSYLVSRRVANFGFVLS